MERYYFLVDELSGKVVEVLVDQSRRNLVIKLFEPIPELGGSGPRYHQRQAQRNHRGSSPVRTVFAVNTRTRNQQRLLIPKTGTCSVVKYVQVRTFTFVWWELSEWRLHVLLVESRVGHGTVDAVPGGVDGRNVATWHQLVANDF